MIVRGRRIQAIYLYIKILLQKFQKRDIDLCILVPHIQRIPLGGGFAVDLHRDQNDGGIPGCGRLLALKPAQQSHCQIEGAGPVLLQGGLGRAVHFHQAAAQLLFCVERMEPAVLSLQGDKIRKRPQIAQQLHGDSVLPGNLHVCGSGENLEFLPVRQGILQHADIRGEQRNHRLGQAHIDQHISQAQVQQFPLPLGLFCRLLPVRQLGQIKRLPHLRGGLGDFLLPPLLMDHLKSGVRLHPGRERTDSHTSRPPHVDHKRKIIIISHISLCLGHRLVKAPVSPRTHGCALHDYQLVDSLGHSFFQLGRVVHHHIREGFLDEPHPRENMSPHHDHDRIQPHGLQARRVEKRQIHAGAHVLVHDRVGQADSLPKFLKTGRRLRVRNISLLNRRVGRRRHLFYPVGVLKLIARQGRVPRPLLQVFCGKLQQAADHRMIGRHKRRQKLRRVLKPRPLVKGQRRDVPDLRRQNLLPEAGTHGQSAHAPLREGREVVRVDIHANVFHAHLLPRLQLLYPRLVMLDHPIVAVDLEHHVLHIRLRKAADSHGADNLYPIMHSRICKYIINLADQLCPVFLWSVCFHPQVSSSLNISRYAKPLFHDCLIEFAVSIDFVYLIRQIQGNPNRCFDLPHLSHKNQTNIFHLHCIFQRWALLAL